MNNRGLFDARHITEIFLWALRRKGRIRVYWSGAGDTIVNLSCGEHPNINVHLRTHDIHALVEQLRWYTAIDIYARPEAVTTALAQITLIANQAGPKVSGFSTIPKVITPLVHEICTEFAVACAISFAEFHNYAVDSNKIPRHEAYIALLMNDDKLLARIFGEALYVVPSTERRGRHERPGVPDHGTEEGPEALLRDLEIEFADANPIPGPGRSDAERQLSASRFRILRAIGELNGWSADKVLMLVDEHLSPYSTEQDAELLLRYAEEQLAEAKQSPGASPNGAERQLAATPYWNLRSMAELKGWSAEEVLILIGERLSPNLLPDFVHYSDSVSGPDWQRLYAWICLGNGN